VRSRLDPTSCHTLSSRVDFGESHYLNSPHSQGDVPTGADQWTNGFDHSVRLAFSSCDRWRAAADWDSTQGWLKMTSFLAQGFKTGSFPTPSADQLVLWARPHPTAATASADSVPRPTNAQYVR
jgi:glucan endo-1,3-alpha-glucosidase